MTYNNELPKTNSQKDLLCIIKPAFRAESWTNVSGTVYSKVIQISNEFLEYVCNLKWNGVELSQVYTTPAIGEWYYDFSTKTLYINNNANPSAHYITVFFEVYFATKTINTYRIPTDNTSQVVYYSPRILSASIPQISTDDLLLFGSYSGSINLINTDSAFYKYDSVSFRNKEIVIYHMINGIDNLKLIYSGSIDNYSKNDSQISFNYRQIDSQFNRKFVSNPIDQSRGYYSVSEFPLLDLKTDGYAVRAIFGVVDDIFPVNIDYNQTPTTSNNRNWIISNLGSSAISVTQTVAASPSSTTTRVYLPVNHGFFEGESVIVSISSVDSYCYITSVASNYIEVSPTLPSAPSSPDTVRRDAIGYVKIKDQNGNIYQLLAGRDYNQTVFNGVSTQMDCLGFTLTNNFEANHPGLPLFTPESHKIFVRCYGIPGDIADRDVSYKVITTGNKILEKLLTYYLGLSASQVNSTEIKALTSYKLGFSIPESLGASTPTYREIIKNIQVSTLSQVYYDSLLKINLRNIGPFSGLPIYTITDRDLLSLSIDYQSDNIYSLIRLSYKFKEAPDGSDRSSTRRVTSTSNDSTYLHEEANDIELTTYLLELNEAQEISDHYAIIFSDYARSYSFNTKTQLMNALIGDVIEIERTKLDGHDYDKETLRNKLLKISSIKKSISSIEFIADPQKQIEDNSGSW